MDRQWRPSQDPEVCCWQRTQAVAVDHSFYQFPLATAKLVTKIVHRQVAGTGYEVEFSQSRSVTSPGRPAIRKIFDHAVLLGPFLKPIPRHFIQYGFARCPSTQRSEKGNLHMRKRYLRAKPSPCFRPRSSDVHLRYRAPVVLD
jgi:hypothetical protein